MERKNKVQLIIISFLLISFTMAFININKGRDKTNEGLLNVYFDSSEYNESEGSIKATSHILDNNNFSFQINLNKPGDFYEASTKVINDEEKDVLLERITITGLNAEDSKYLTYEVTYDNQKYDKSMGDMYKRLPAKSSRDIKVRIEYKSDAEIEDETRTANIGLSLLFTSKK